MKIYANNYSMPLEHPDTAKPNPDSIPGSCWYCGFLPEEASKDKKEDGKKCPRCGMWTIQGPSSDPILLTDPSVQDGPMESSVVVNVSHKKQAVDFTKGLTPQSLAQLKSELQVLGLPLDSVSAITRILDDYRNVVQQSQQQMQQTQLQQSQYISQFPVGRPTSAPPTTATRIKANDILKEELQNKIEEVVDKLVDQGADEDDAKEAIKALVDNVEITAAIDRLAVWAEPIVKHDYTPPLAESSKEPIKKLRKPRKIRRKKK